MNTKRNRFCIPLLLLAMLLVGCSGSSDGEDSDNNITLIPDEEIEEEAEMIDDNEIGKGDDILLNIARTAVTEIVNERSTYQPPEPELERLKENSGVFVTLKYKGGLRGCIGYVEPIKPLYIGVRDNAINAATRDTRFLPIKTSELEDIYIEISVMTPLAVVDDYNDIEVGRDGLYIEGRGTGGLLLPQVAPEQGWDRVQFLEGICTKAGLPRNAYKDDDITLYSFSAYIFGAPLIPKEPT